MASIEIWIFIFQFAAFFTCTYQDLFFDEEDMTSFDFQEALANERKKLLYPYSEEDYMIDINSAKPMHDQPLQFRLPFYGFEFTYIWIHKDGYVTFNRGLLSYAFPVSFPVSPPDPFLEEDPSLIAPWMSIQDIPREVRGAGLYLRIINMATETDSLLRQRILLDFRDGMLGSIAFEPRYVIIVTWKNMTVANRRAERPLKTNTYQMVLATNEMFTYVMFNYEWITWITHTDNYDGMKGPAAFVGFNAGNTTRSFEYAPYSQNPRVYLLPKLGYGNGLRGRYYFQVDEDIFPGACIEKQLDPNLPDRLPLSYIPAHISMLGGEVVNVTGPCLHPDNRIFCRFDNWKVDGVYINENLATCISPPVMYNGYVDLTVTVDDHTFFASKIYVQPPEMAPDDVKVLQDADMMESPESLTITWSPDRLSWNDEAKVAVSLWGYREKSDIYPSLTYIDILSGEDVVFNSDGSYEIDVAKFAETGNWEQSDITFGFVAVNLTDPTVLGPRFKDTPVLWSRPMPLAWYFRPHWENEYGKDQWKDHFCSSWYNQEKEADRFAQTVFRCPCTLLQAELDRGRFSPDLQCNIIDRKCDIFHHGAQHCVKTARPSVGGSGQTCCYDDYGELLQTADSMYGGRPSRAFLYGKHPFKMRMMVPTLSSWLHDVMPFFFCCKWQPEEDNAETCNMFKHWRTSQDCSLYQSPAIGSVYGDPHFVTFDRYNYTFNGKGEFVLVHVDNAFHKLDVHARFEQVPRASRSDPIINATKLTAVAARDNTSSIVEFRMRPDGARWQYHILVFVDKMGVYFWDESMQVQNFRGVTLYQPSGIRNMSHIIAMFDSGAGVEVISTNGYMTVHVYLPESFLNGTAGLLGKWSLDVFDEFTLPDGRLALAPGSSSQAIHDEFGEKWRLQDLPQKYIGSSLFYHNVLPFSHYDDVTFRPVFIDHLPNTELALVHDTNEMYKVCGNSMSCRYDLFVTGDSSFASATRQHEAWAHWLGNTLAQRVVRCPSLEKPKHGRKSENRYYPGTIVRFACDEGYRLVGHEVRRCRDDGLWSWGTEAVCISEEDYTRQLIGIIGGIIAPLFIMVAFIIGCFMWSRKRGVHYTGEDDAVQRMTSRSAILVPDGGTGELKEEFGQEHDVSKEADA